MVTKLEGTVMSEYNRDKDGEPEYKRQNERHREKECIERGVMYSACFSYRLPLSIVSPHSPIYTVVSLYSAIRPLAPTIQPPGPLHGVCRYVVVSVCIHVRVFMLVSGCSSVCWLRSVCAYRCASLFMSACFSVFMCVYACARARVFHSP